uniref:Essential protein Yae1 N-terminal domain-containing protein n=1 Tax=Denticeps clupeoides TaxID=299321 RepID=A0AAY4BS30_9TELE
MSWVKALGSSEDVFDENADDISLQSKEWKYNMEKRAKDGFRDGINAGKEASLQAGFNQGYRAGGLNSRSDCLNGKAEWPKHFLYLLLFLALAGQGSLMLNNLTK